MDVRFLPKPRRVSALDSRRSVLIVDASDETRVVLQTALERRGVRTMAASQAKQGLALAQQHHPDLIVLDLEIDASGPDEVAVPFAEQSRTDHASLVLLGGIRRREPTGQGEYVAKPYHYAPLIRRIEEILSARPDTVGALGQ
jgi:CheY-like chemotaxis protein